MGKRGPCMDVRFDGRVRGGEDNEGGARTGSVTFAGVLRRFCGRFLLKYLFTRHMCSIASKCPSFTGGGGGGVGWG